MNENQNALRQCQLVQLRILHAVDEICRKHGLKYFLYGGTLLGAMRHNGFIPWDDDLDIGMPMEDYRKFIRVAKAELPDGVMIQTPSDYPHSAIPFVKIRDTHSFYCEVEPSTWMKDPSGIYIDVFAFEKMPKLPLGVQRLLSRLISSPWMRQRKYLQMGCDHVLLSPVFSLMAIGCWCVHGIMRRAFGLLRLLLPCEDYFLELEKRDPCPFKINWLEPYEMHRFEDAEFPIPRDADACLRAAYGDWHWIPPPEQRPIHARIVNATMSAK